MPEYLAPGVFVEEVSFRQQAIEGVSTSTAGFIGPTRFGPVQGEPALLTSFSDFERIYGGLDRLDFTDADLPSHNFLAHAVRAYFEEGGLRLYVARTYAPEQAQAEGDGSDSAPPAEPSFQNGQWNLEISGGRFADGIARYPQAAASPAGDFGLRARYPGAAGNVTVRFLFRRGENIRDDSGGPPVLRGAAPFDVVLAPEPGSPAGPEQPYWLERFFDEDRQEESFRLRRSGAQPVALAAVATVRPLSVSVEMGAMGRFSQPATWENLSLDPRQRNSLSLVFAAEPTRRSTELFVPLVFHTEATDGAAIADALLGQRSLLDAPLGSPSVTILDGLLSDDPRGSSEAARTFQVELTGGSDGNRPGATTYEGDEDNGAKSGLRAFEDLEDISIVAAPGATFGYLNGFRTNAEQIIRLLIGHCERMRYRVAVLDSGEGSTPGEVRDLRSRIDSTRAALYYPWVRIFDPVTEVEVLQPPSGFIAGIYARNDTVRGVHKAPANEVVRLALGFEFLINKAQQEALNPEGINCLRFFEGRGFRVWGARTVSSDVEWRYVNVRRYFAFLERSIEKGTQFAVFEPNGPALWANVQRTVSDFLFNEWAANHLLGTKPEEAFFVRCDRTTMSQLDLDLGRLICLVGVAPLKPAEFVIFRIGQKTASART